MSLDRYERKGFESAGDVDVVGTRKIAGTEGFTTIEAIVAIAIIAAAGTILAIVSGTAIKSLFKTDYGSMTAADYLAMDTAIRSAAGRVRIPWWESRVEIVPSTDSVEIPWLDGEPENELRFSVNDGHLIISVGPDDTCIFRSRLEYDAVSFTPLPGDGTIAQGIEVAYSTQNESIKCAASFASFAMGKP